MDLEHIQRKIHEIRRVKIILDFDLAYMYEVETRVLNQTVRYEKNIYKTPCN
jgi:hypothetical protein